MLSLKHMITEYRYSAYKFHFISSLLSFTPQLKMTERSKRRLPPPFSPEVPALDMLAYIAEEETERPPASISLRDIIPPLFYRRPSHPGLVLILLVVIILLQIYIIYTTVISRKTYYCSNIT